MKHDPSSHHVNNDASTMIVTNPRMPMYPAGAHQLVSARFGCESCMHNLLVYVCCSCSRPKMSSDMLTTPLDKPSQTAQSDHTDVHFRCSLGALVIHEGSAESLSGAARQLNHLPRSRRVSISHRIRAGRKRDRNSIPV